MAKICDICGKKPQVGNMVSHSHHKTKTRNLPNLQNVRLQSSGDKARKMTVCTSCIKRISKYGQYKGYSFLTPVLGQK